MGQQKLSVCKRKFWLIKQKSLVSEQNNPLGQNFGRDKHDRGGYANNTPDQSG
jgi:hypothetical protein